MPMLLVTTKPPLLPVLLPLPHLLVVTNPPLLPLLLPLQERGNANAQWWANEAQLAMGGEAWVRVGLRQMSGIVMIVFCRWGGAGEGGRPSWPWAGRRGSRSGSGK